MKCPHNVTEMKTCDNCKTKECTYDVCSKCYEEKQYCLYVQNAETMEMEYVCQACHYGEQEEEIDITAGICRNCKHLDSLNEEELCFDCYWFYKEEIANNIAPF